MKWFVILGLLFAAAWGGMQVSPFLGWPLLFLFFVVTAWFSPVGKWGN